MASAEAPSSPPWESKKAPSGRGLIRRLILWGGVLGVLALVGYGLKPRPVEVEAEAVKRGPLTVHVQEEGKTRIRHRYIVSAPLAGNMRRVTLRAGDEVKANDTVLTVIEPGLAPLLDARSRAQAEAHVAAAEAMSSKAKEGVEMARTAAQFARTNWDRVKSKAAEGSISASDRDMIERDAQMRDREVRAAEFALKVADYETAQARAALMQMDAPSSDGIIEVRAPVSGRVLKVQQESATMIATGTPILEVGDPTDLEIEAEILSRDAVAIQPGAEATVEQWGGDMPLKARVRRVEPAAFTKISALGVEEQRVIVLCDMDTSAPARALGDRYRVELRIAIWHDADVLLVPAGALFREGSEWRTFVMDYGKAKIVTVKTGRTEGKLTQVLGGLAEGDKVLMHPPDSVKDGVQIVQRAAP